MYSAISSFKSYISTKAIKASVFLLLSVAMLAASIVAVQGVVLTTITLIVFCGSMSLPFMGRRLLSYSILLNHQIFYILPLLVSVSLSMTYDSLDYTLQIIAMACTTILCSSEIAKIDEFPERNQGLSLRVIISVLSLISVSYVLSVIPELTKLVSFFISFSVYLLLDSPVKKIMAFRGSSLKNNTKVAIFASGMVSIYGFISFTSGSSFLAYLLYIVFAINLGFCFRENKATFLLFSLILLLASLIPFGPVEKYIDNVALSCAVILFHLKSPILYYKKNQYGELKVLYEYRTNKIYLVNNEVIQGEKFIGVDNRKENLLYLGNASKGSVIASIFELFNKKDSKIAVLGLGAGAMAMLGGDKNIMEFYEINPEIVKISYDRTLFNYLSESDSRTSVITGDGREELSKVSGKQYGLIVVDVYLGGDVPNHFLTKEAVEMYLSKLDDEGVVVFHIENHEYFEGRLLKIAKSLKLESIVAYERYSDSNAEKYSQGLLLVPEANDLRSRILKMISNVIRSSEGVDEEDEDEDEVSRWIVISRKKSSLKELIENKKWFALEKESEDRSVYTDEYIGYNQTKGSITQEVD
jgi:spermidine synthase